MITIEELKAKTVESEDGCWEWTGYVQHGHPYFIRKPHRVTARRAMYELSVAPIPEQRKLLCKCENPLCINPAHMKVVKAGAILKKAYKEGKLSTYAKRVKISTYQREHNAKLTLEQAREIRESPNKQEYLATVYGVSRGYISHIKSGRKWPELGGMWSGLMR